MRTINLIQFTNYPDSDFGFIPNLLEWYKVGHLNDEYEHEYETDEGDLEVETLDSISILHRSNVTRRRHVIKDDGLKYNLLTFEVDEESNLFGR